jgi:hypothetical protein
MELITDLISSIQLTLDSINKTVKKYQSQSKVSSDRKLQIAIKTAQEICSTYDAVQHGIAVAAQQEGERYAAISLELQIQGYDPYVCRPKYRYWTEFCPDVAIGVLHTLMGEYSTPALLNLIKKLVIIVKPFRAHTPEQIETRSLGIKPYKFNSYAVWHNSFSDHGMSYALWRECGFE